MKKLLNLSLLMVGATFAANLVAVDQPSDTKGGNTTGHTFFWVRPQFQDAMPEKVSLWRNDKAMARDCGWGGAFQVVPFGGRTTSNTGKRLAQYFMFENKTELTVNTDQSTNPDINPINFNILYENGTTPGSYSSTIQFRPRQSTVGAGFDYIQYFGRNECCERKWWGEISFPVVRVRNDMRLTETNQVVVGDVVDGSNANMIEAFAGANSFANLNNPNVSMNFGRIDGRQSRTGVADIELKIGYDYMHSDCAYLYSYLGVLAPTDKTVTATYVFDARLGENKHVGILTGGSGGFEVWTGCGKSLWMDCDIAFRYLIRRNQLRSFDLKNRPWSRYLLVYANEADQAASRATPGINIFTQKLKIHPHFQFDINTALVYNSDCGLQAELGYNVWARQGETARLATPWAVGPAVAAIDIIGISPNVVANSTNLLSNIGNSNIAANTVPAIPIAAANLIQESDLDLTSATHPACLSQTIYGTVGYNLSWCWPIFVGVGGSYEFSRVNTAVSRWTVWGKFGVSL